MRSIIIAALLLVLHTPALAGTTAPQATGAAVNPKASTPLRMDVNRATAAELVSVPGIGERLAQAIIELRERKGSFTTLEDLLEIRGIGEKSLALLGEHLTVVQQASNPAGGSTSSVK